MALNEIAKHFYEKEVDRLLDLDDRDIIKNKFIDMRSQIDDLYVELGERARRIVELEKESERPTTGGADRVFAFGKEMDIRELFDELLKANKRIAELESELSVKEDLLKIKNGLCEEEPLPFSCDACSECYEADLQELQHTHLKDRMTISKLKIAIGVLTEQYAELREEKGLTDTQS